MNLTNTQRDLLAWLIEENERGQHNDVIPIVWTFDQVSFEVKGREGPMPPFAKKALMELLQKEGLIVLRNPGIALLDEVDCVITGLAFQALSLATQSDNREINLGRLTAILCSSLFTMDDLEDAVLRLGINDGGLRKDTQKVYARELVQYAQRRDMLWQLVRTVLSLD